MTYSFDDLTLSYEYTENIDYLDVSNDYLSDNRHLLKCINYTKSENTIATQRLNNICWRRMYKNLHDLPLTEPWRVNWDKAGDITWLYGPKLVRREIEFEAQGLKLTVGNLKEVDTSINAIDEDEDTYSLASSSSSLVSSISFKEEYGELSDDSSDMSSIDSGYITDYSSTRPTFPPKKKLYFEVDFDYSSSRPILKSTRQIFAKQTKRSKSKKVSFNYIINSREIINGMSVDYDFLDQDCL